MATAKAKVKPAKKPKANAAKATPAKATAPKAAADESATWLAARGLETDKPTWNVQIYLSIEDRPAPQVYFSTDTVCHLRVFSSEWDILLTRPQKSSMIRRIDGKNVIHGRDDLDLVGKVPSLDQVGDLIASFEAEHGVKFRRDLASIRTNVAGAKKVVAAWLPTL
jgi:hypothetical protein